MLGRPSISPFLRSMLLASVLGAGLSTRAMAQNDSIAPIRCDGRLAGAPPSTTHRSLTVRPLTEDAVRVCVAAPKQRRRDPDAVTYRQEGTINGVAFAFDEVSGSGLVHGDGFAWRIECTIDAMTDAPTCLLSEAGSAIPFFRAFLGRGGYLVSFGGQKYPGSELEVRVDSLTARRAPERPGFVSADARDLLAEMASGRQALLRLTEWPSRQHDSRILNLKGFGAAYELFTRAFYRIEYELQAAKKPGF